MINHCDPFDASPAFSVNPHSSFGVHAGSVRQAGRYLQYNIEKISKIVQSDFWRSCYNGACEMSKAVANVMRSSSADVRYLRTAQTSLTWTWN